MKKEEYASPELQVITISVKDVIMDSITDPENPGIELPDIDLT